MWREIYLRYWPSALGSIAYVAWLVYTPRTNDGWAVLSAGAVLSAIWSISFWKSRRTASESWMRFSARTWDLHLLGAWLLMGLVLQQVFTEGITSDGALYLGHLRSLLFDGDFEITRELQILNLPPREHHVVPIGPTIVWAPLYLAVWAIDAIGRAVGAWPTPSDTTFLGLTYPYRAAAIVSSYIAAAVGLVAVHIRLREEFGKGIALLATVLLSGATPLAWYAIYEPSIPHATSFGVAALLTAASIEWLWKGTSLTPRRALTLGALCGAVATIRTQDAVFMAIPALAALEAIRRGSLRLRRSDIGWAAAGFIPFVLAQIVMLASLAPGQQFALTGEQSGYLRPTLEHLFDVLFSSWYGLFTWTPLAYIALIGTICYVKRQPYLGVAGVLVFCGTWLANGLAHDWHGSWAFGARRFVSSLVVLAPGLALALDFFRRRPAIVAAALVTAIIGWNTALMVQFHRHVIPRESPVRFDTLLREPANWWIPRLARFYPFAFPHNIWFSLKEGLPLDRYDELGYEPFSSHYRLVLEERADRFLFDGWSEELEPEKTEVRWIHGRQATLVLPIRPLEQRAIQFEVEGYADPNAGPVPAIVDVEINGLPIGHVRLETTLMTATLVTPADTVPKVWRTGFNRVTLSNNGAARIAIHAVTAGPL